MANSKVKKPRIHESDHKAPNNEQDVINYQDNDVYYKQDQQSNNYLNEVVENENANTENIHSIGDNKPCPSKYIATNWLLITSLSLMPVLLFFLYTCYRYDIFQRHKTIYFTFLAISIIINLLIVITVICYYGVFGFIIYLFVGACLPFLITLLDMHSGEKLK